MGEGKSAKEDGRDMNESSRRYAVVAMLRREAAANGRWREDSE